MKCCSLQLLVALVIACVCSGCGQVTTSDASGNGGAGTGSTGAASPVAVPEPPPEALRSVVSPPAALARGLNSKDSSVPLTPAAASDVGPGPALNASAAALAGVPAEPASGAVGHSGEATPGVAAVDSRLPKAEAPPASAAPPSADAGSATATSAPATSTTATVAASDSPEIADKPAVRPLSAAAIRKVVDLRTLPRLAETGRYSEGATLLYYGARASVRAADGFYRAELESQNWTQVPGTARESQEYADRLYVRDGIWLRVSIGAGGEEGIVGVNLIVLGNMDLTQLPRAGNAEYQEGSSPVNVSYRSPASIVELATFCQEQLTALGWIPYTAFENGLMDPPHVRTLTFLQEAVCLRVLIHRDPMRPAEPSLVAMFCEQTLAFDLPMPVGVTGLKLDIHGGRAEYLAAIPMAEVAEFVSEAAARYGWESDPAGLHPTDGGLAGVIQDGPEGGFSLGVSSSEGRTRLEYQRLSLADPEVASRDSVDSSSESASVSEEPVPGGEAGESAASTSDMENEEEDEIDRELAGALRDARQAIAGELGNLRSQLSGLPGADALTNELEKQFPDEDEDEEGEKTVDGDTPTGDQAPSTAVTDAAAGDSDENAWLVPAIEDDPKAVVNAKVSYDQKTLELKHILLFQVKKHGEFSTVIFLADRPFRLSALKSRKIGDLSLFDLFEDFDAQSMELRIGRDYTSINCHLQGGSISLSSGDVKSELKPTGDRISGRVYMEKPEDFFDKPFQIDVQFDVRPARVEHRATAAVSSELEMEESDGLPVPAGNAGTSRLSSAYRSSLTTSHSAPLGSITELYRSALPGMGWQEVPQNGPSPEDGTGMLFRSQKGELAVRLNAEGAGTRIEVVLRDETAARKADILPPAGRVRIVFGNANDAEAVIELDGKPIRLAAHEGETDVAAARKTDVAPGLHQLVIKVAGSQPRKEEFTAAAGSTWGVIAVPGGGCFVDQVF